MLGLTDVSLLIILTVVVSKDCLNLRVINFPVKISS